jgi:hypothetical protein
MVRMIPKPWSDITGAELEQLVATGTPETATLDYKAELPGLKDEDKREFLYDISSLANTHGGDVVFGVAERVENKVKTGVPEGIVGTIDAHMRDAEELRLTQLLLSGVDPRIDGIRMKWIPYPSEQKQTLVVRVPRSYGSPHMVIAHGANRFYGRSGSGKYQMDVRQLRAAFDLSGDLASRLRSFRSERITLIETQTVGVPLPGARRIVLHIVPLSSFDTGAAINLTEKPVGLRLLYHGVEPEHWHYNVDGYVVSHPNAGYTQLFRNGRLESVDARGLVDPNSMGLPSTVIEDNIIKSSFANIQVMERSGARPPYYLGLTLLGMNSVRWSTRNLTTAEEFGRKPSFDRNMIVLPDVMIDPSQKPWSTQMRPLIDLLWQAAGRPGSENYAESGVWLPDRGQY